MFNIVEKYMQRITKDDVNKFAIKKNVYLSNSELDFTYDFIKKNYANILKNHSLFKIDRYENRYSKENFPKVKKVFTEYFSKYQRFL